MDWPLRNDGKENQGDEQLILRILFFVILGGWLFFWARKRIRTQHAATAQPADRAGQASVPMKACAHCGILLPEPAALREGARHYCCPEHRQAGPVQ